VLDKRSALLLEKNSLSIWVSVPGETGQIKKVKGDNRDFLGSGKVRQKNSYSKVWVDRGVWGRGDPTRN